MEVGTRRIRIVDYTGEEGQIVRSALEQLDIRFVAVTELTRPWEPAVIRVDCLEGIVVISPTEDRKIVAKLRSPEGARVDYEDDEHIVFGYEGQGYDIYRARANPDLVPM